MSAELPAAIIAANAGAPVEVVSAYIGPGSGIGAVGALAALVATGVLMVIGFLWYPVKRILRSRRKSGQKPTGWTVLAAALAVAVFAAALKLSGLYPAVLDAAGNREAVSERHRRLDPRRPGRRKSSYSATRSCSSDVPC